MMLFQLGFLVDEGDEIGAHVDNLKQKVNRLVMLPNVVFTGTPLASAMMLLAFSRLKFLSIFKILLSSVRFLRAVMQSFA